MQRFAIIRGGLSLAMCTLRAQDGPKSLILTKEDVNFSVPSNYSPVRIARLGFHPTEPNFVTQVSDKRLAVWDLNAKLQLVKGKKEATVLPEYHVEQKEGWITGFDIQASGNGSSPAAPTADCASGPVPTRANLYLKSMGIKAGSRPSPFLRRASSSRPPAAIRMCIWDPDGLKVLENYSARTRPISE